MRNRLPRIVIGLNIALTACSSAPEPGVVRPAMAAVPAGAEPRYDAFERALLTEDLVVAAAAARHQAARADARWEGSPALPPAPAPPLLARPLPPPAAPPRPEPLELGDDMITADDVIALAQAVLRDRRDLARRAAVVEAAAAPAPTEERVTAVVFPPAASDLPPRERRRLERALGERPVDRAATWIVVAGGPRSARRAEAVRDALVDLGVDPMAVEVRGVDRAADVVEIRRRR